MATAKNKTISQVEAPAPVDVVAIAPDIDIESMIADELLNDIDWQKVRAALIKKAPAKLFAWLVSSNDTPINISQFPELAQLPSGDDEGKAA